MNASIETRVQTEVSYVPFTLCGARSSLTNTRLQPSVKLPSAFIKLTAAPKRWTRQLYDWTMHWAETPRGLNALFFVALIESSFFPIPPDLLLIAIVAARPQLWLRASAICSIGSLVGAAIGYAIGAAFMNTIGEPIIDFYRGQDAWERFSELAGITIASGATGLPFVPFLTVSLLGRASRFLLVALLLRLLGPTIREKVEENFDLVTLLLLILLIGGFVFLKLL